MAITRTPIIDDDGSGTTGTVIDNAWKQELYNQIDGLVGGPTGGVWNAVPFDASKFGAAPPLVWTVAAGHVQANRYLIVNNKTLLWNVYILGSTLSGAPSSQLHLILPVGLTAKHTKAQTPIASLADNVYNTGFLETTGGFYIGVNKTALTNYALGPLHVAFTAVIELA